MLNDPTLPRARQGYADVTADRQARIKQEVEANEKNDRPPFQGVALLSWDELQWVFAHLKPQWSTARVLNVAALHTRADLRGVQLVALNLAAVSLYGANLRGANCFGTVLSYAYLGEAQLAGANLRSAQLDHAYLEAADLSGVDGFDLNLYRADLRDATLRDARLIRSNCANANLAGSDLAGARLDGALLSNATLTKANLRGANLANAQLIEANLTQAELAAANLSGALLYGATCIGTRMDAETDLTDASVRRNFGAAVPKRRRRAASKLTGGLRVRDLKWNGVSLARLRLLDDQLYLGDEEDIALATTRKDRIARMRDAARAYQGIALALRSQGLSVLGSAARLREQELERQALFAEHKWGHAFGWLLLEVVSGYGERVRRTVIAYAVIVAVFAVLYFTLAGGFNFANFQFSRIIDALVLSVTSFHGRGFFPGLVGATPHDPSVIAAAVEALFGLVVEANLIAAFSRRFLGN